LPQLRLYHCGASWSGIPARPPAVAETPEDEKPSAIELEVFVGNEFDRVYRTLKREEEKQSRLRWAGFVRRATALLIDLWVLAVLSLMLFYFSYAAAHIGLAAHDRQLSAGNIGFFLRLLFFAWVVLVAGYFVVFHVREGKTVGEWLLGLRVVGEHDRPLSYRQALIRSAASLFSGLSVVGILWIIWQREKRGWHDLVARTWVVRDWARASTNG
jgi:uncharacterized RDD family membrane protein YckC